MGVVAKGEGVSAAVVGRWKRHRDTLGDQQKELRRAGSGDWTGFGEARPMTVTLVHIRLVAKAPTRNAELKLADKMVLQVYAPENALTLWLIKKRHLVAMTPAKSTHSRLALSLRFPSLDLVLQWSALCCKAVERSCLYAPRPGRASRHARAWFKSSWGAVRQADFAVAHHILTLVWAGADRTVQVDVSGAAVEVRVAERSLTLWLKREKVIERKPKSLPLRATIGLQILLHDSDDLPAFVTRLCAATAVADLLS